MAYFKALADHLNFAEFDVPRYRPSTTDLEVEEVVFRHNIVAIRKGDNSVPSNVLPPHPVPIVSWFFQHTLLPAARVIRGRAKALRNRKAPST